MKSKRNLDSGRGRRQTEGGESDAGKHIWKELWS